MVFLINESIMTEVNTIQQTYLLLLQTSPSTIFQ